MLVLVLLVVVVVVVAIVADAVWEPEDLDLHKLPQGLRSPEPPNSLGGGLRPEVRGLGGRASGGLQVLWGVESPRGMVNA